MVNYKSCSVFGHKEIKINDELVDKLRNIFEKLILQENVRYFYFGGLGEFDELCHKIVTELKVKYPTLLVFFVYITLGTKEQTNAHLGLITKITKKSPIYILIMITGTQEFTIETKK